MRKVLAIARRILSQFAHDKRTMALLFVAPIVVLWLLSVLLSADAAIPRIAVTDVPDEYRQCLGDQDAVLTDADEDKAERMLRDGEVDAVLRMADATTLEIWAEGSDSSKTAAAASVASGALADMQSAASERMEADVDAKKADIEQAQDDAQAAQDEAKDALGQLAASLPEPAATTLAGALDEAFSQESGQDEFSADELSIDIASYMPIQDVKTEYLHGSDDWEMFDYYGPVFIGLFLFAFTFITSGMSLVNERSAGTMARFLATPVKPAQILGGYSLGFGLIALAQTAVILIVALCFIGFPNEGNVGLVVFSAVSMALVSVTMGLLVSGLARSAFQVIQLILLFVVPQILLCGLFDLSGAPGWLQGLSGCLPATYGVDALRAIMLRGASLGDVAFDLAIVWAFIIAFFALAALEFRKKKARPA